MPDQNPRSSIPRSFPSEIKRHSLLRVLRNAADHKMIALLAPSGFGKTTLLAQNARSSRKQVVWITLEAEDQDIVNFLQKLLSSLQVQNILPELNIQLKNQQNVSMEHLQVLINQHLGDVRQNIQIILDKTEHLSPEGARWLGGLLHRLPEGHQILVAGYENIAPSFSDGFSPNEVLVLGPTELAFSASEAQQFSEKARLPWNPEHFQKLQGWPLGLSLPGKADSMGLGGVDWLLRLLKLLPIEVQNGLPLLVGEPVWHEDMVLLFDTRLPEGWLTALLSRGLPLTRIEHQQYIPHTLLMEALNQLLLQDQELFKRIHQHHAERNEKAENWLTALDHYLRIQQTEDALRVAEPVLQGLLWRNDFAGIHSLLSRFKTIELPHSWQAYLAASLLNSEHHEQSKAILDNLEQQGFRNAYTCFVHANFAMRQARKADHLSWAEQGLRLAQDLHSRLHLRRSKIAALNMGHQFDAALQEIELYLQDAEASGSPWYISRAWILHGNSLGDMGQMEASEQSYQKALHLVRFHSLDSVKAELYHNLALTLADLGRPLEGIALLNEALSLPSSILKVWEAQLTGMRATLYAQMRLRQEAIADYQTARKLALHYHLDDFAFQYTAALVDTAAINGQLELARNTLALARLEMTEEEPAHQAYLTHCEGLVAMQGGDHAQARNWLNQANDPDTPLWGRSLIPFWNALMSYRDGQDWSMELDLGFELLNELGQDGPLDTVIDLFAEMFQNSIEKGWHAERIHAIFERNQTLQVPPVQQWTLQIQTFGSFQLSSDLKPLKLSLKKCEELLVHLAIHGSSTRDQLIDALWDGKVSQKINDHFRVLVRKLRAELTQHLQLPFDPLPFAGGFYSLNRALYVNCDAAQFMDLHTVLPEEDRVNLYQGPFFPRLDTEWASTLRAQARQRFLALVEVLLIKPSTHKETLQRILSIHPDEPALARLKSRHLAGLQNSVSP